ncbi:MAG: NAD-binding protein, partial [Chloroflexota bacterium]|nr:NAD-binding protein [Chloroflexota bacterium]
LNPARVRELRAKRIPAFYGDAAAETVLAHADVARARTLAVATPDLVAAEAAIRHARRLNPRIRVIARATANGEVGPLGEAGADEVVQPEFEAGLEFVRQVLRWHDAPAEEVAALVGRRRADVYGPDRAPPRTPEERTGEQALTQVAAPASRTQGERG